MKLKQILVNIAAGLTLLFAPGTPALVTVSAAAPQCGKSPAAKEVLDGVDFGGADCGEKRVDNLFKTVVQILTMVVGIASVIVIIYAGFKYITSGGEQGKVANAKSTLLYAIVGLAIAALAQLMIHFVLAKI